MFLLCLNKNIKKDGLNIFGHSVLEKKRSRKIYASLHLGLRFIEIQMPKDVTVHRDHRLNKG